MQKKIIEEAMKFFMLYGIKCTSMSMIAASLHISKKTLYEYFPGKDELLRICVLSTIENTKEAIIKMEKGCHSSLEIILGVNNILLQKTLTFCPAFYRDLKHYQNVLHIIDKELRVFVYDKLLETCNSAVEEHHIMHDYNYEFLFSFFENNLFSFYFSRKLAPENQMELFRHTIQVYLSGICTDKGRDFLKKYISPNEKVKL